MSAMLKHGLTRKLAGKAAIALSVVLTALQLIPFRVQSADAPRPPGSHMANHIDSRVAPILERSCGDCHSDNTRWPWYSRVAPVSWIVLRDVEQGKRKVNFSEWARSKHTANEIEEICDAVSDGSMPLRSYTWLHREARLSPQDVDLICKWSEESASSK